MTDKETYDFIIIGSGMGGLLCGTFLSMEGYKVLILEKNQQIGGSLQVFSRDKCIFDTGVHFVGSLDENETLYKIFKYAGIYDKLNLHRLDSDCFDLFRFNNGKSFKMGQGYDKFKDVLYDNFPEETKAIDTFCNKIIEICEFFPLYSLKENFYSNLLSDPEILNLNAWDYVNSLTNNKTLRDVLLANGPLYAGEKAYTPFYVVALITNSYLKGSYRFINGGSQIASALSKRIHELGGRIMKHQKVVSIQYHNNNAVTLTTSKGYTFSALNFISNIHPKQNIALFGEDKFRNAYTKRINNLEDTVSSFTVYISFIEDSFPYLNYNIYDYFKDDIWETVNYDDDDEWPTCLFTCTPVRSNQGKYSDSLTIMTYMNYEEVKKWEKTFNTISEKDQRSEEYEKFKKLKENQVLDKLEIRFPNIREKIKNVYSSTPLTYRDYIGTETGSMYGIKKNVQKSLMTTINSKTKIPNVFLTGQNLVFHGILGVSIGALVTCFNFINKEELTKKIRNV